MTTQAAFWEQVQEKARIGERLSREEGIALFRHPDLLALGMLAREVKRRKSGDFVYFNVNRHINLTNVCVSRCRFCAFSRDKGETGAYTMSVDQALQSALEAAPLGISELHIVSGLHPDLPFSYYLDVVRTLKQALPDVLIQAFTAVEIQYFSQISGLSVREVLSQLKEAGLISMPGGGAEVFSQRVRDAVCPHKASGPEWLAVMDTAHSLGIKTNATMLYGHMETIEERVDHLVRLREQQDKSGGFQSFIPLKFHPDNTALAGYGRGTAVEDLRMMAVSRLMLDNFDHVKAFWIMLTLPVSQLALEFGADDLDGTVVEERITHAAGAQTGQAISKNDLLRYIREAGRVPVERDTLYNVLRVYNADERA